MSDLSNGQKLDDGTKFVATAGATALVSEVFFQILNHFRGKHGLDPIEDDKDLTGAKAGGALVITSALVPSDKAPLVAGVGAGVAGRSIVHALLPVPASSEEPTVYQGVAAEAQEGEAQLTLHKIPMGDERARWREVARIFRGMMNEDRMTPSGAVVPAERWHPEVVRQARHIVSQYDIDASQADQVIPAVWDYFHRNYTGGKLYSWDPNRLAGDYFVAPHLFLKSYEEGGMGMVGDCDDVSMAVAAVLLALGFPAGLALVKQKGGPGGFTHVLPVALLPDRYAHMVPKSDPRYRTRMPSGEKAVVIPMEFTRPRPWLFFPKYRERGFVFFDETLRIG